MVLYYITDRRQFPGDEASKRTQLLDKIEEAAQCGVDFIQIREKDLSARELESLVREARERILRNSSTSKILVNSRIDVAVAAGADGVHLPANDISPDDARNLFRRAGIESPVIGVSCHTVEEVVSAEKQGADFVVFGAVFEKPGASASGIERLREACKAAPSRVFALGGVTLENAAHCIKAGAAGIAGIRLFQSGYMKATVATLRQNH